ncbi:MAG: endonuclease III, partial [candidate division Zixibacteria bacterium]
KALKAAYPDAECSLNFRNIHQLMVATILSAQCTDERVNIVTKDLFKKYRSVKDFAEVDVKQLEKDIHSTGFYKNKAKSIKKSAQQLLEDHNGNIPKTLDELVKLTGVGRKTGSVVLGAGYGLTEGIVVDTHVIRISNLLKLANHKDAVKIEKELMKILSKKDWIIFTHLLIDHGRAVCIARRPDCASCTLKNLCPSAKF